MCLAHESSYFQQLSVRFVLVCIRVILDTEGQQFERILFIWDEMYQLLIAWFSFSSEAIDFFIVQLFREEVLPTTWIAVL